MSYFERAAKTQFSPFSVAARGLAKWDAKGVIAGLPNAATLQKAVKELAPHATTAIDEAHYKKFSEDGKCSVLHTLEDVSFIFIKLQ